MRHDPCENCLRMLNDKLTSQTLLDTLGHVRADGLTEMTMNDMTGALQALRCKPFE